MWNNFKKCRNEVVNILKSKKSHYYFDKIERFRNNPKEMCQTLENLVNMRSNEMPQYVQFENR